MKSFRYVWVLCGAMIMAPLVGFGPFGSSAEAQTLRLEKLEDESNVPAGWTAAIGGSPEGARCMVTEDCDVGLVCLGGICSPPIAMAPAISPSGLLLIVVGLFGVAMFGLKRRAAPKHSG
jgi:hypothetical protein